MTQNEKFVRAEDYPEGTKSWKRVKVKKPPKDGPPPPPNFTPDEEEIFWAAPTLPGIDDPPQSTVNKK